VTVHVFDGARCRRRVTVGALLSARYRHDSVVLPCSACENVRARCMLGRSIAWVDWATLASWNSSVVSSAGSLQVAGVFHPCTGIVSRRAFSGMRVPTRGKRRLHRGGLSMWRHRAHNYLCAFKVVARLCAGGLRRLSAAVLIPCTNVCVRYYYTASII